MQVQSPMYIFYVHDMQRALAFYRDVFELEVVQETQGWSMLRVDRATLALHILSSNSDESLVPHAGLNLHVDDLDAAIEAVVSAGGQHIGTREANDFVPVRMCELRDTEGNGFELRQHVHQSPDLTRV